jgi:hypothetical protein
MFLFQSSHQGAVNDYKAKVTIHSIPPAHEGAPTYLLALPSFGGDLGGLGAGSEIWSANALENRRNEPCLNLLCGAS